MTGWVTTMKAISGIIIVLLCTASSVIGAGTVSVVPAGPGDFLLTASGLDGAAGADITVAYDAAALADPRVEQGSLISGAMFMANTGVPGIIRIAIIRLTPISGSGSIASLSFGTIGNVSGPIKGLAVRFTDINGNPLQVQTQVLPFPETAGSTGSEQPASQGNDSRTSAATTPPIKQAIAPATAPGVLTGPSEAGTSQREMQPVPARGTAPTYPEPSVAKADESARRAPERTAEPPIKEKAVYTQKSVLDLFREHKGPRTPKALLALFEHEPLIGCKQEPPLILTDGRSVAKVAFISPIDQQGSPDIALIGATLVSLERDWENTNTWIATVRPHRNAVEVKMTISMKDSAMVFPLTVAPKVSIVPNNAGKVTEADLERYLKDPGGKRSAGRDLNRDGKADYLDDYIFIANYLASTKAKGREKSLR